MSGKLPHHRCSGRCEECDKSMFYEKGKWYTCDPNKTAGMIVISKNPTMRRLLTDIKCYARGCDYNNIDCTCMYGSKLNCHVNCDNCVRKCKKVNGERACRRFKRGNEK